MEVGRWHIEWSEKISPNTESGPEDLEDLKPLALNRLDQVIFGVKTRCLIYLNLCGRWDTWTRRSPRTRSPLS